MKEIIVYEPHPSFEKKFVPKLVEQIISKGSKVFILCRDEEQVKSYDELLWSYEQLSFLPHVTNIDHTAAETAIVIGANLEQSNGKNVMLCLRAEKLNIPTNFEKVIYLKNKDFNENYLPAGIDVSSFKQLANGSWNKA